VTSKPLIVMEKENYLSYEILVSAFGPVKTKPNEPQTHYSAQISIWSEGREIEDAKQTSSMHFLSREDAIAFGFEIGRMTVTQRYKSSAFNPLARVRKLFKLPRLLFRNKEFRSRHAGDAG